METDLRLRTIQAQPGPLSLRRVSAAWVKFVAKKEKTDESWKESMLCIDVSS
jgi:hypothetical protein